MYREGHVGAALLVYAPLAFVATAVGAHEFALLGGLAMAPDVDMRLPGVPHRGPTHTIWFAGAVGVATGLVGALIEWNAGLLEAISLSSHLRYHTYTSLWGKNDPENPLRHFAQHPPDLMGHFLLRRP